MLAISQYKPGVVNGNYNVAGQLANNVVKNVVANPVTANSAVAGETPVKNKTDVVKVEGGRQASPADFQHQATKDFPANYLKKIGEDFPPDLIKKAYEAYKQEFPQDILKEYAKKFPPNYLKELSTQAQVKAPEQSSGFEKQAIKAYSGSSNAQE